MEHCLFWLKGLHRKIQKLGDDHWVEICSENALGSKKFFKCTTGPAINTSESLSGVAVVTPVPKETHRTQDMAPSGGSAVWIMAPSYGRPVWILDSWMKRYLQNFLSEQQRVSPSANVPMEELSLRQVPRAGFLIRTGEPFGSPL